MSTELTDHVGEPIAQKLDKAMAELSNAREDVETGKHMSAILSFIRAAREYVDSARDDILALEASQPAEQPRGEAMAMAWLYRSPAEIEFNKDPSITRDAELVRLMREAGDHEIIPLAPVDQPKPEQARANTVSAVVADGVSESGHQLYTLHDESVPMADNWRLVDSSAKPEQAVGDGVTFEQWYADNAFDLQRNPIGGRECALQRVAWNAALALSLPDAVKEYAISTYPRPAPVEVGDGVVAGLRNRIEDALRHERHRNNAETRYWLNQYKGICKDALGVLTQRPAVATAGDGVTETEDLASAARAMHVVCDGEDRWQRMPAEVREQWIESVRPIAAALASRPVETAQGEPDSITRLIHAHASMLDANPYAYFELAYTRGTGWMAWLCDKPASEDPSRKVLAWGQDDTPHAACSQALALLAAAPEVGRG